MRFVAGPAKTIRKRFHRAFDWKVRLRSSGGSDSHSSDGVLAGFMSPAKRT